MLAWLSSVNDNTKENRYNNNMNEKITTSSIEFRKFPKIARLSRDCIITEKLDGTNASIYITDDGEMLAGSGNRWITPSDDHYGFARWANENKDDLMTLGPGHHFGEWWGQGIQRKYGMTEKRWSLFNVSRWCEFGETPLELPTRDPRVKKYQVMLPACCSLVPVLFRGPFTSDVCDDAIAFLGGLGSVAAPGFMKPEGIVCFHLGGNYLFKKTIEHDEVPKGKIVQ